MPKRRIRNPGAPPKGLDILRRATTPMTDEQSAAFVREHYGVGRENVSGDDLDAAVAADALAGLREAEAGHFLTDEELEAALTKPLEP